MARKVPEGFLEEALNEYGELPFWGKIGVLLIGSHTFIAVAMLFLMSNVLDPNLGFVVGLYLSDVGIIGVALVTHFKHVRGLSKRLRKK